jgi:hypothetical protein
MKIVLLLLSFILSLSLSAAHAIMFEDARGMKPPQPSYFFSNQPEIGRVVEGEVLRIDGSDLLIADQSGNEVRLRMEDSTVKIGAIKEGARIEARVNHDDYALSIISDR